MAARSTMRLAVKVIRRLRRAGHEALLAGGCVRDMLMGRRPTDYDVATSATPQEVRRLFPRVLMVGAKFGVAIVLERGRQVEVATFRSDLSYSDGRRPDAVKFVSAREDALRRDFTINGMFYDPLARKVVDYVGGRADLAAGVIRAIGEPGKRFAEDHLRMLRAVRFAARFDFRMDPATADAIRRHAGRIVHISGERVREELEKMLAHPSAALAVEQMHTLGLLEAVLPELFEEPARWPAARQRLAAVASRGDVLLGLAALMCELSTDKIRGVIRRWGGSNATCRSLCWMARHLHDWPAAAEMRLCDFKRLMANADFERLRVLWRFEERKATGRTTQSRRIARRAAGIPPERIAPAPLVTGDDLLRMGLPEGPRVGRILRALYDAQLDERLPDRRAALKLARQFIAEG